MTHADKMDRAPGTIGIGLLGMGVVGSGVAGVLLRKADELAARTGRPLSIEGILVRDLSKARPPEVPAGLLTTDPEAVLANPNVDIVVEVIGGREAAHDYLHHAIDRGKHVVTANKELVAHHGQELLSFAAEKGVHLRFEASVAAGTPLLAPLMRDLAANEVLAIRGIVNGTTNYILTEVATGGVDFDSALRQAQALGYAEPDPTNDIEGLDAAYKLSVLCHVAWGVSVDPGQVYREGITGVEAPDFTYAWQRRHTIKHLATARRSGESLAVSVYPTLVPEEAPIAQVGGVLNAIEVETDLAGPVVFQGPGAGPLPTASAIVADIIEIAGGRGGPAPARPASRLAVRPIEELETRYYLRIVVDDRAGVRDRIGAIMSESEVGVDSMVQKQVDAFAKRAELVLMTHRANEGLVQRALRRLEDLQSVHRVVMLRVEGR